MYHELFVHALVSCTGDAGMRSLNYTLAVGKVQVLTPSPLRVV